MRRLRIATMAGGYELLIPVHSIQGSESGPTLTIVAGQHGNEVHSTMAALNLLHRINPRELRGTVLIVPVANPVAFEHRVRATWIDALHSGSTGNMNRVWPGRPDGFLTERIAFVLTKEVISNADVVIDMHNGTPGGLAIYYSYHFLGGSAVIMRANSLALAFGMEILIEGAAPDVEAAPTLANYVLRSLNKPIVMVELGDFWGLQEEEGAKSDQPLRTAVEVGTTGVLNVMRALEMIPGPVIRPQKQVIISPERRCQPSQGGILIPEVSVRDIGSFLAGGHLLATVIDPFSSETLEEIRAPFERNLLLSVATIEPYLVVHPGDQAFHVADLSSARWVTEQERSTNLRR